MSHIFDIYRHDNKRTALQITDRKNNELRNLNLELLTFKLIVKSWRKMFLKRTIIIISYEFPYAWEGISRAAYMYFEISVNDMPPMSVQILTGWIEHNSNQVINNLWLKKNNETIIFYILVTDELHMESDPHIVCRLVNCFTNFLFHIKKLNYNQLASIYFQNLSYELRSYK